MKTAKPTSRINPAILPDEELRQLVFQIIIRDDIEPFLRRMVVLLDSLKAGQTDKLAQIARQSKDPSFVRLMSVLSDAVQEGELVAARITVFLAASYAYQETRDYFRDVMGYLNKLREGASEQSCSASTQ
jgi:hypothetical protein